MQSQDTNKLGAIAEDIQEQFSAVKNNFSSFVDTYSTWAEGKEGELTQQIEDLEQEIRSLTQELNSIETAQKVMVALAGAAIPIANALGTLFEPVKPLILVRDKVPQLTLLSPNKLPFTKSWLGQIGGLIFAGVALAAVLGLYIAAGSEYFLRFPLNRSCMLTIPCSRAKQNQAEDL